MPNSRKHHRREADRAQEYRDRVAELRARIDDITQIHLVGDVAHELGEIVGGVQHALGLEMPHLPAAPGATNPATSTDDSAHAATGAASRTGPSSIPTSGLDAGTAGVVGWMNSYNADHAASNDMTHRLLHGEAVPKAEMAQVERQAHSEARWAQLQEGLNQSDGILDSTLTQERDVTAEKGAVGDGRSARGRVRPVQRLRDGHQATVRARPAGLPPGHAP